MKWLGQPMDVKQIGSYYYIVENGMYLKVDYVDGKRELTWINDINGAFSVFYQNEHFLKYVLEEWFKTDEQIEQERWKR